MPWTAATVEREVISRVDELFAFYAADRPAGWTPDAATKRLVSTGRWLSQALASITDEEGRRLQEGKYNRLSRSYDPFEVAAEVLNEAIEGRIDRARRPHRRWG